MKDKEVGEVGVLLGVLSDVDVNIFSMKDLGQNMKLMSTYSNTDTPLNQ